MKKLLLLAAIAATAWLGCKGNSKGCKIEDQCGRQLESGSNASCTEIRCVPNACEPEHQTVLGKQICGKDGSAKK